MFSNELWMLQCLAFSEKEQTCYSLSKGTGFSPSSVHRLIQNLCDQGLVSKQPSTPGRGPTHKIPLRLTPQGQEKIDRLHAYSRKLREQ